VGRVLFGGENICLAGVARILKENLGLPTSQKSPSGNGLETYWPAPPRARIGLTVLEPAGSSTTGSPTAGLNKAFLMRLRIPLVAVFCGFLRGLSVVALKAVPSFSFRFLSERSLASGEGGVDSLVGTKLFSQRTVLRGEGLPCALIHCW